MSLKGCWWRRLFGSARKGYPAALEFLRARYVEERQQARRFSEQAARMQYPQFRNKLLTIAAEEATHADWLADKIKLFGGKLPVVPDVSIGEKKQLALSGGRSRGRETLQRRPLRAYSQV